MIRLAALILAWAALQEGGDALGTLKAPQALTKSRDAWAKKKGCHVKVDVTSTLLSAELRALEKAEFEGKVVRDFMWLRGSAEIFGRGTEKLVRQDNNYVEPRRASGRLNRTGSLTRNPAVVLDELFRFTRGATFGADEKSGDVECRIVETAADERTLMEQVKEVTGSLKALEGYFIKDFTSVTDRKKSTSKYKAWISRADLLPARLEWTLTITVNKKSIPFGADEVPDQFEVSAVYLFTKYDTELQIDVPPAVKAKFGAP